MNQITIQLNPETVRQMIEKHLNETMLDKSKRARVTAITGYDSGVVVAPGQPNHQLTVTLDVITV